MSTLFFSYAIWFYVLLAVLVVFFFMYYRLRKSFDALVREKSSFGIENQHTKEACRQVLEDFVRNIHSNEDELIEACNKALSEDVQNGYTLKSIAKNKKLLFGELYKILAHRKLAKMKKAQAEQKDIGQGLEHLIANVSAC